MKIALTVAMMAAFLAPLPTRAQTDTTAIAPPSITNGITDSKAWAICKPSNETRFLEIMATPSVMACLAKHDMKATRAWAQSMDGHDIQPFLDEGHRENANSGWYDQVHASEKAAQITDDHTIVANIVPSASAPAVLTACSQVHLLFDPQWIMNASWKSRVSLTAVKIRFDTMDAFGKVLHSEEVSPTGDYKAGAISEDGWIVGNAHMPPETNARRVSCTLLATIDANGKIWNKAK